MNEKILLKTALPFWGKVCLTLILFSGGAFLVVDLIKAFKSNNIEFAIFELILLTLFLTICLSGLYSSVNIYEDRIVERKLFGSKTIYMDEIEGYTVDYTAFLLSDKGRCFIRIKSKGRMTHEFTHGNPKSIIKMFEELRLTKLN